MFTRVIVCCTMFDDILNYSKLRSGKLYAKEIPDEDEISFHSLREEEIFTNDGANCESDLCDVVNQLNFDNKSLKNRISFLQTEVDSLEQTFNDSFSGKEEIESAFQELQAKCFRLEEKVKILSEERDDLESCFNSYKCDMESSISKLKCELTVTKALNKDYINKLSHLNNELQNQKLNFASKPSSLQNEEWLTDIHINNYLIQLYPTGDLLILNASQTELFKMHNSDDLNTLLEDIKFSSYEHIAFILNDRQPSDDYLNEGNHWSLMVLCQSAKLFLHFDSLKEHNNGTAKIVVRNINFATGANFKLLSVETPQQSNSYDCGVEVLCNLEQIISYFTSTCQPLIEIKLSPNDTISKRLAMLEFFNDNAPKNSIPVTEVSPKTVVNTSTATQTEVISNVDKIFKKPSSSPKLRKCLIVADSHGRQLQNLLKKLTSSDIEFKVVFKPGSKLNEVLLQANGKQFDALVIVGGTNDFPEEGNILAEVESTLKSSHDKIIYLVEIPLRFDKPSFNDRIRKVNANLEKLTESYNNLCMVHINDGLTRSDYTRHGLHLNKAGKQKVSLIIGHVVQNGKNNLCIIKNYNDTHQRNELRKSRFSTYVRNRSAKNTEATGKTSNNWRTPNNISIQCSKPNQDSKRNFQAVDRQRYNHSHFKQIPQHTQINFDKLNSKSHRHKMYTTIHAENKFNAVIRPSYSSTVQNLKYLESCQSSFLSTLTVWNTRFKMFQTPLLNIKQR